MSNFSKMIGKKYFLLLWIGLLHISLCAEECPALLNEPDEIKALGEVRLKAIKGWDKILTWTLSPKNRTYHLKSPLEQKIFRVLADDLFSFNENYGYFSIYHPIVGIVTKSKRDIEVTKCLLESIHSEIINEEQLLFSTDEILAKVIAYRALKKGMKIPISTRNSNGEKALVIYVVDQVIDLWRGMPAYGLVPEKKGASIPILLFRGTDLSITSEKGWASILSDLDISGPGYTTFIRAQKEIHQWLEKMKRDYVPARLMGFSLGGAFVMYTLIYEHDLISKNPNFSSVAFNPSGISKQILEKWENMPEELKSPHIIYVNQGDFVSQIGFLLSNVWEVTLDHPMQVIEAHVSLISAQPLYKLSAVDVQSENQSRE